MAIPVAMQAALLLLNHLNEIGFPLLYPHYLSLVPKKPVLMGTSFKWVTTSSWVWRKTGTVMIKLQKSICIDRMAEMDDGFSWEKSFSGKKNAMRLWRIGLTSQMLEHKLFQAKTTMLLGISVLPSTVPQWLICTAALEIMNRAFPKCCIPSATFYLNADEEADLQRNSVIKVKISISKRTCI